jgi:hypothetical protein
METPKTVEVRPSEVHDMYNNYINDLKAELEECKRATGFVSASDRRRALWPQGGKRRKSKSRKTRKSRKHRKTYRRRK